MNACMWTCRTCVCSTHAKHFTRCVLLCPKSLMLILLSCRFNTKCLYVCVCVCVCMSAHISIAHKKKKKKHWRLFASKRTHETACVHINLCTKNHIRACIHRCTQEPCIHTQKKDIYMWGHKLSIQVRTVLCTSAPSLSSCTWSACSLSSSFFSAEVLRYAFLESDTYMFRV